jgi:hypothetical protein
MPGLTRQQRRAQERNAAKRAGTGKAKASSALKASRPFLLRTRTLLAIAASIATMGTAAYAFWPTLEIEGVPWDNSRGPLDARFLFTNAGRVPIYQVHFRCTVNTTSTKGLVTEGISITLPVTGNRGQDLAEIPAGVSMQRDCGSVINAGPHPSNVKIDATFRWPFTSHIVSVSRFFVSNTDSSGRSWMSLER